MIEFNTYHLLDFNAYEIAFRTGGIIAVFLVTWTLQWIMRWVVGAKQKKFPNVPIEFFFPLLKIGLWAASLVLSISIAFQTSPIGLLTGLAGSGAVIMFILKDRVESFISGVKILSEKTITKGQFIKLAESGYEGEVLAVTISKVILSAPDERIHIPIQKVYDEVIKIEEQKGYDRPT